MFDRVWATSVVSRTNLCFLFAFFSPKKTKEET